MKPIQQTLCKRLLLLLGKVSTLLHFGTSISIAFKGLKSKQYPSPALFRQLRLHPRVIGNAVSVDDHLIISPENGAASGHGSETSPATSAECATGSRHGDDSPFLAPTTTESMLMLHAMSVQLSLASLVLLDLCCVIFACCSMLASPADRSHAWQPHAPLVFEPAGSKVATASSQCSLG